MSTSRRRVVALPLLCEECEREWKDPVERWRVYMTDDVPPVAVAYCPQCAQRVFDE